MARRKTSKKRKEDEKNEGEEKPKSVIERLCIDQYKRVIFEVDPGNWMREDRWTSFIAWQILTLADEEGRAAVYDDIRSRAAKYGIIKESEGK